MQRADRQALRREYHAAQSQRRRSSEDRCGRRSTSGNDRCGKPGKFMELWKNAGVKVIPVVASVAMAKMMERAGADAVVAEGMESGGTQKRNLQ